MINAGLVIMEIRMNRKEFQDKLIEIGGHCAICELEKIVDWIIEHKEEIPEKEKKYGRDSIY